MSICHIFLYYGTFMYNDHIANIIKVKKMKGKMNITYKILCQKDTNQEISIDMLLKNEKVIKAIKSEFGKGIRNLMLTSDNKEAIINLATEKEFYTFEVNKNDFADILVLAEENAQSRKLFKKECDRVEIVDIETL
jgi:hypothetical protein